MYYLDFINDIKFNIIRGNRYSGKWFSQTFNALKRKCFIMNSLYYNMLVKNSYFIFCYNFEIDKINLKRLVMLKEICFYGFRNWYPYIVIDETLPCNMREVSHYVKILNNINKNKEKLK